jgi:alkylation response protein AidB-like acyl-CoA dehydrogenase
VNAQTDTPGIDPAELREALRAMLADHAGPAAAIPDDDGAPVDRELWSKLADMGCFGLPVSEDHGGMALGMAHLGALYEELGRALAAAPVLTTLLAACAIDGYATEAAKARHLPGITAGETMAAFAFAFAAAGPPRLRDGRLEGAVAHVPFASEAALLALAVEDEAGGLKLALIDPAAPGVRVEPVPLVDLTRRAGRVTLAGVTLEPDALVSVSPEGWEALRDHAAVGLAADSIGGAAAVFERTIEYLGVRVQFGRPIGSFQALKHRAASWKVLLEAATALVRNAAAELDARGGEASALVSGAKFYACDVYSAVCGDAVQLHGGIGFTWEHPCHLFLKRAKLNQQLFGSSTEHKDRLARLAFSAGGGAALPGV